MPGVSSKCPIAFLAVTRLADKAKLAVLFSPCELVQRKTFETSLEEVQEHASQVMYPGWKEKHVCDEECGDAGGAVWARIDDQGICLVAVGVRDGNVFSQRVAMQLLRDFAMTVKRIVGDDQLIEARAGSLTASLRASMLEIMKKQQAPPAKDKIDEVQEHVDVTKVKMQENIQTIIESLTTLEDLQEKSRSMSQRADDFCKKSAALKHQVRVRNIKVKIITATCAGAALLYLLLPLMQH